MTTFGNHTPRKTQPIGLDGTQWLFAFPNGYGASVINDGYGRREGLLELAVLNADGHIAYCTPITNDVRRGRRGEARLLGWLTPDDVARLLDQIEDLPADS